MEPELAPPAAPPVRKPLAEIAQEAEAIRKAESAPPPSGLNPTEAPRGGGAASHPGHGPFERAVDIVGGDSTRATLKNSWTQAGTDIVVGAAEALSNVADIGKYALNVPAEIGRGGANLVGLHVTDEIVGQFTAWNMPSPSEVARDFLRSTDNPTAKAAAERIDSALRRRAGVMVGFAELHNVAYAAILPTAVAEWTRIDPKEIDGPGDAIVAVVTGRPPHP